MEDNPDLDNDLASKYGDELPPAPSLGPTWQDREQKLAKDISTEGTLASYLIGRPRADLEIQSLISAGKVAEAKEKYDARYAAIDANRGNMSAVAAMDARNGTNARLLRDQAEYELRYEFNKLPVTTVDGQQTTLGRFFADPNMYKDPGKSYEDRGFYRSDVDAFLNSDDEELRRSLGFFMKSKGPLHLQDKEAAHAVHVNWRDITDVFGKGSSAMVQNLYVTHRESGAAAPMLKSMIELGRAHAAATKLKDEELTGSFFGAYRDLIFSAYRGDPDQTGSQTRDVTPNKRLQADALITRTLAEMAKRDSTYSMRLDDPGVKGGLREAVSMIAEASADGIDLVKEAAPGGNLYDMLAKDMADRASGFQSDSVPERWRRFNDGLRNQFTGGRDFARTVFDLSGDPLDYLKLDRSAGGRSTNQAADGISAAMMARLRRTFVGDIFGGKTPYAAWNALRSDPLRASAAMNMMVHDLEKYFTGPGARSLATQLAESAFNAFGRGTKLNVETLLRDAANSARLRKASPLAYESARSWFYGNVAAPVQYADKLAELDRHVASEEGGGLNDRDRAAFMSRMRSRVAEMAKRAEAGDLTVNPGLMLDEQLNRGQYYRQVRVPVMEAGRQARDENGKPKYTLKVERHWTSNLRRDRGEAGVQSGLEQGELKRQWISARDLESYELRRRTSKSVDREFEEGGGQ